MNIIKFANHGLFEIYIVNNQPMTLLVGISYSDPTPTAQCIIQK